jgi:hypothetical protein
MKARKDATKTAARARNLPPDPKVSQMSPGHPQYSVQRPKVEELGHQKSSRAERYVLETRSVSYEFDGGPIVLELPEDVRGKENEREAEGEPRPSRSELPAQRRNHGPCRDSCSEGGNTKLVHQAKAQDNPQEQPEPRARRRIGTGEARQEKYGNEPENEVKGVHRVKACDAENRRRSEYSHRRQNARKAPASEEAGEPARQEHRRRARQRRQDPERKQRIAEQRAPSWTRAAL